MPDTLISVYILLTYLFHFMQMDAGHLQECNKQLFEDQLRRVIVEANDRLQKAKSQPGTEGSGERTVLDTQQVRHH